MKKWIPMLLIVAVLVLPVSAAEFTAPEVPEEGAELMPEDTASFSNGLRQLLQKAVEAVRPDLANALSAGGSVIAAAFAVSILSCVNGCSDTAVRLAGTAAVTGLLLQDANAMLLLAKDTVIQLSAYGKLLLPVMTAAMAAQGGITASAGLYIGTAFFDSILGSLLTDIFVPLTYLLLALSVGFCASGEELLKRIRDLLKAGLSWSLKTVLMVFTTYMSITGVVSGTTDAAALKAAKVSISTFVPLVGGILSEASEAVLVGAGVMKNTAGIYGIFAALALGLGPFLKIAAHYLVLKVTAAFCGVFEGKEMTALVEDFSGIMGILLGITGAMCLLLLISTVCFMKGVS